MIKGMLFLAFAILSEVFGTTMLKLSDGFTNLWPTMGVGIGFLSAFLFMSFALKTIPLSMAYATWSGIGTALTAVIGMMIFQEHADLMKIMGLSLVIGGIVLLNISQEKEASGGS
ncbi:Multidrug resistance protein EbrB [Bacillus thermotolerans]|uniref:Multidrug resistance protein EbrB n=1 Tax=Bacillus thermotolerans TaxID=1221996 RepID=A0A0F5HY65_BACTR|nr:Multidrug resistance protein EbrB [Bacillus thermotolerans]KKB39876.1 Multidrug resistance protein EbrB [Bacillus thermotolerans]KKB44315.1 Multidrug resistance protein EbrB [Bacillus thermotolerans]